MYRLVERLIERVIAPANAHTHIMEVRTRRRIEAKIPKEVAMSSLVNQLQNRSRVVVNTHPSEEPVLAEHAGRHHVHQALAALDGDGGHQTIGGAVHATVADEGARVGWVVRVLDADLLLGRGFEKIERQSKQTKKHKCSNYAYMRTRN